MRLSIPAEKSTHTIDFDAICSLMPILRVATRLFRYQLKIQAVPVRLSSGCLVEFVTEATDVVARTRRPAEPYMDCLSRHLRKRAQFVLIWATTHEPFGEELHELVKIARRFNIPRPLRSEAVAAETNLDQAAVQ